MRLYDLTVLGWIPDSYEQIAATQRLLQGDLPLSRIYPPGVAIVMAPFFLLLPDSLGTMQLLITGAGIALAPAAYLVTLRLSNDRVSAVLAALLVALSPAFLLYSRSAFYDTIYTVAFVAALFLPRDLHRRSIFFLVGYGALLALLANFRVTFLAMLPALLVIWLQPLDLRLSLRSLLRDCVLTRALIVPAVFAGLMLSSLLFGGWFGQPGSPPTLDAFIPNLIFYYAVLLNGLAGPLLVLPLAVLGVIKLWRGQRSLAAAICYLILVWPAVFAQFYFVDTRYMLPPLFLVFVLVATGASVIWSAPVPAAFVERARRVYAPAAAAGFLLVFMAAYSATIIGGWDHRAAESDPALARELQPRLTQLDDGALLVSAMLRGLEPEQVRRAGLDLIDHHRAYGSGAEGVEALTATIDRALADNREVYYLFSRYEAGDDMVGDGRQGFGAYFDAVEARFGVNEVFRTSQPSLGKTHWVLYQLDSR